MGEPGSDERDLETVEGGRPAVQMWCSRLGLGAPSRVRRLRVGQSGSLVLALRANDIDMVVKVTADRERLTRAAREARLLRSGALDGVSPRLVASATGPDWVAIATRECTPLRSATQVDLSTWTAISISLAAVHRRVVDAGIVPVRPAISPVPDARSLQPWVSLGAGEDTRRGARQVAESGASPLPGVLEHGDAHLDNLLQDVDGGLVWVDWQEACIGDGISDLVFCWQRAEFAGAQPPRAEMTDAYAKARGLDHRELEPLVDHIELRLLIESWPPFLSYGTPAARAFMRQRLAALISR